MKTHPAFGTKKNSGLTLIELLVVIAILALLLLIAFMSWRSQFDKAKDAAKKDDLQRLSIALENYFNDNDCYPIAGTMADCATNDLVPYIQTIPCDPVTDTPYCYIPDITDPSCPRYYRLLSSLDYTEDPIITKLQCHGSEFCGYEPTCATPEQSGYNYGVSSLNIPVLNPLTSPPPASAPPSPGVSPSPESGTYACTPTGICNSYEDTSSCLLTWSDPNACTAYCPTSAPEERCAY